MNFEDAFKHYKDGTATDEEKELVLDELAKAKALSSLMDDEALAVNPAPLEETEKEEIRGAKKAFKKKNLLIALISVAAALLVIAAILGGVFGSAATYAKQQVEYGDAACTELAKGYLEQFLNDGPLPSVFHASTDSMKVKDCDADFHFEVPLQDSYYTYRVKIEVNGTDYKVGVDTRTGKLVKINVD